MKTLLTAIPAIGLSILCSGQGITSGKIIFEEKVKIEIKLEGDAQAMAANLPRERKMEKILTFTGDATLFEDGITNTEDEISSQHGDGNVRIRMVTSGENKIFTDLKNKKILEQRDFMNRIFLVEKDFPETEWKITGNQKIILGYNCMEAVRNDTAGNKTVAWFTPSIAVAGGPAGICNLPGMVLEADINSGSRVYVVKSIEPRPALEVKLQKPKDGKAVTEEEYREIVAEKLKEMGVENGGGGTQMRVMIRHQ